MPTQQGNTRHKADRLLKMHFHIDSDSKILMDTSLHSRRMLPSLVLLIISVIIYVIILVVEYTTGVDHVIVSTFFLAILMVCFVYLIFSRIQISMSAFGVTETEVLLRMWPSQTVKIPVEDVNEVKVNKYHEKRVSYGNLMILSIGRTYFYRNVIDAKAFMDTLTALWPEKEEVEVEENPEGEEITAEETTTEEIAGEEITTEEIASVEIPAEEIVSVEIPSEEIEDEEIVSEETASDETVKEETPSEQDS